MILQEIQSVIDESIDFLLDFESNYLLISKKIPFKYFQSNKKNLKSNLKYFKLLLKMDFQQIFFI